MAVCKRQRAHAAISRGVINDADQTTEAKAKRVAKVTLRQTTAGATDNLARTYADAAVKHAESVGG